MRLKQLDLEYTLVRSKRKTVALYIRNGGVEVRAPLKTPVCDIERFILSKEKWIADKLADSKEQSERRKSFTINYGDTIMLHGKQYPLKAVDGNRAGFDGESFFLPPGLSANLIKTLSIKTYRMLAKKDMTMRVYTFSIRMRSYPSSVKITGARTRWGSCSTNKSVNFSWRLLMADEEVIDYVVVHELAHLKEMNHSARFWKIVEGVLPDYRDRKKRLLELQKKLANEDW